MRLFSDSPNEVERETILENPNNLNLIIDYSLQKNEEKIALLHKKSRYSFHHNYEDELRKNKKVLYQQIQNNNNLDTISFSFDNDEKNIFKSYNEKDDSMLFSTKANSIDRKNFSTDDLIYRILLISLEKLEEISEFLSNESYLLKNLYLELSEEEKDNFFKKILSIEVSLQLISQETLLRKRFLKYSKIKFKLFNKITKNLYFNKSFNFFCEIMISRLIQIELNLSKIKNLIQMIKENFNIIIFDNLEKDDNKLNLTMKILAIITAIFTPYQVITSIYGMNVKVPFGSDSNNNFIPFYTIIFFLIFLSLIQIFIFRKWKWI